MIFFLWFFFNALRLKQPNNQLQQRKKTIKPYKPSTRLPHNSIFCGFKSKCAIHFLCKNCSALRTSCIQNMVCRSVNEPFSSSSDCSSPPFAISNINAVSTFVSCTECNLTMCSESAHSRRIAISCRISLSVHCARRLRLRNFAAKLTPVFLCSARRTVANLPLWKLELVRFVDFAQFRWWRGGREDKRSQD